MRVIADHRIPDKALKKLELYAEVFLLKTSGLVYEAISGHPDIFFSRIKDQLVIAPDLPPEIKNQLIEWKIPFHEGNSSPGMKYPETAKYNCVATDRFFIHHLKHSDTKIRELAQGLQAIQVNQGYTRCNLLPLPGDRFITSDQQINKKLTSSGLDVLFVRPDDILLPGFKHGFFGGACGFVEDKVFMLGALSHFKDGDQVRAFIKNQDLKLIELYNGPLFDGGSLLFL